jgi:uncharacterized protein (DUF433 family)
MTENLGYQWLEQRRGSNYRQLFFKGRNLRAETLYRRTIGIDPMTPDEVAADYHIPVDAVHEAIDYCRKNEDLLRRDREKTIADIKARGLDKPPYAPPGYVAEP